MDNNCHRTAGFRDTISDNYIENICQRNETIQFLLVEALAALPRVITSEMTRTIFFPSELYSDIESIWIIVISSEWFDKDKKIKSEFYENRRHLSVSWRDFYNLNKCSTNSCMLSIRFLYWYIKPF